MGPIPEVDVTTAREEMDEGEVLFLDIRDPDTRARGHIPNDLHLTNDNFESFLAETDRSRRLVVYCYHGNASRMATAHLLQQGFTDVRSLAGGYTEWAAEARDPG